MRKSGGRRIDISTKPWDAADYIDDTEDAIAFLNAVLELDDPELLPPALGVIARSRGIRQVANASGLGRESLYKALREGADPRFSTVGRVLSALGYTLRVEPVQTRQTATVS